MSHRKLPPDADVRQLVESGQSVAEIAEAHDCSPTAVYLALYRAGYRPSIEKTTLTADMAWGLNQHLNQIEIAELTGLSRQRISQILVEAGYDPIHHPDRIRHEFSLPVSDEELMERYKNGESIRRITESLNGVSRNSVWKRLKGMPGYEEAKNVLDKKSPKRSALPSTKKIVSLIKDGIKKKDVASMFSVTPGAISNRLRKWEEENGPLVV